MASEEGGTEAIQIPYASTGVTEGTGALLEDKKNKRTSTSIILFSGQVEFMATLSLLDFSFAGLI